MAILIRRTLTRAKAPIFSKLQPDCAARDVGELGGQQARSARRAQSRTHAIEANHSRSWFARIVAADVWSANRSSWHSYLHRGAVISPRSGQRAALLDAIAVRALQTAGER